jgi:hypothetical protein
VSLDITAPSLLFDVTVGRLIDVSLAVGRHPRRRVSPNAASL